jgi:hypothetical protein
MRDRARERNVHKVRYPPVRDWGLTVPQWASHCDHCGTLQVRKGHIKTRTDRCECMAMGRHLALSQGRGPDVKCNG